MAAEAWTWTLVQQVAPLPAISLLIATGMYILNDLVDSDLDRANGKKRPIPSGLVSKKQAWTFIIWTSSLAVLLAVLTLNYVSIALVVPMLAIGLLYSAPRVSLADRFIVKTLSIALFYMLCALLGMTSSYGLQLIAGNPIVPVHAMFMLGTMIFISSVFNDMGDIEGDRQAKRRTIPIVIGRINTVKMAMVLITSMAATSWLTFALGGTGLLTAVLVSAFAAIVFTRMTKMLKGLDDMEFMRRQHKKLFPLHLILQSSVAAGAVFL
ncbi:UbiA family prenyltransferase [Nitrososphaera sp.]|uniref:UbiA prenyltransferase family protein n=1 Tax=Nitrososphaera sp. TaxID=1971748 RepID=UPI00307DAB98